MPWFLDKAVEADIDELMSWFPDAQSVDIWGGPRFRYPFDRESFHEDCRWQEFSSFCLRDVNGNFAAFGQIGKRYKRSHLARLIAHPERRGQGIGRILLQELVEAARTTQNREETALFVYQHNAPAIRCYLSLAFEFQDYPEDAPMADECYYMTKKS